MRVAKKPGMMMDDVFSKLNEELKNPESSKSQGSFTDVYFQHLMLGGLRTLRSLCGSLTWQLRRQVVNCLRGNCSTDSSFLGNPEKTKSDLTSKYTLIL